MTIEERAEQACAEYFASPPGNAYECFVEIVTRHLEANRDAVLEEAAKVADADCAQFDGSSDQLSHMLAEGSRDIAVAIRALKSAK